MEKDISPVRGSAYSGSVVSSVMEYLSPLLISQMKVFCFLIFLLSYPIYISEFKKSVLDRPRSWIGKLNIVRLVVLPKLMYRFSVIPIKIKS